MLCLFIAFSLLPSFEFMAMSTKDLLVLFDLLDEPKFVYFKLNKNFYKFFCFKNKINFYFLVY